MNSEEIDRIFEAYKNDDMEYIWNCAEMNYPISVIYLKTVCKKVVKKIEQGDFKYFLTKKQGDVSDVEVFVELLQYSSNIQEKKKCIKQRKELGLGSRDMVKLIIGTNDLHYMKKCIKQREKIGINSSDIVNLIKEIGSSAFAKKCIKQREKLGLEYDHICDLINLFEDDLELIKEFIKQENINLESESIVELIKKIDDSDYTKECILQGKNIGLNSENIEKLIKEINDLEFTKKCIMHGENMDLPSYDIINLIYEIDDPNFTKKCITEYKELGIHDLDLKKLKMIHDDTYLNKILNENEEKYTSEINLPTEMTIGIEIESVGKDANDFFESKGEILFPDWICKYDSSIRHKKSTDSGVEIASPILTGSNKSTTKAIRKVGTILNELGQYTNDSCGGHIHIGADYLTNVQAWKNLLEIWGNTEPILYIIGNEKGDIPRSGINIFAEPISGKFEKALSSGTINLNDENDLKEFKLNILKFQRFSRYR